MKGTFHIVTACGEEWLNGPFKRFIDEYELK